MQDKLRILIVEDEIAIRNGLIDVFVYHGFAVGSAADGREGLRQALTGTFDMILLDVMLPGIDGFEICHQVRSNDPEQAIIMLTAKTSDDDIVQGLSLGADDYVAKPFSIAQLVLRVQAVLRRSHVAVTAQSQLRLGEHLVIDTINLVARGEAGDVPFTRREMDVLLYLAAHTERAVSRDELLTKVWGYAKNLDLETRTIDIHIAKLRRKIEVEAASPQFLVTIRGAGYRLLV